MSLHNTLTAPAHATLPDPAAARFADRLYRLDGGHSLANDESVWTPGEFHLRLIRKGVGHERSPSRT
jgi:hypothetical protein